MPLLASPSVAAGVVLAYDRFRVWTVLREDVTLDVDAFCSFESDRVAIRSCCFRDGGRARTCGSAAAGPVRERPATAPAGAGALARWGQWVPGRLPVLHRLFDGAP